MFQNFFEAREIIRASKDEYNMERSHSSSKNMTPFEYAESLK